MSKSYNNTIGVTEPAESVAQKVMAMVTDPARVRRQAPGNPDNCNLFPFHVLYSPPDQVKTVDLECRTAARGCVDCKKHLIANMNPALDVFRWRKEELLRGLPTSCATCCTPATGKRRAWRERRWNECVWP
jgi:tryptophanyl-tRNA synthetase